MEQTAKLYSYGYKESKTYLFSALFIAGNIILPQLCHLIPSGGLIFLPIYFFTLIAAYKYGLTVGVLTAVASPLVNSLLFGMPPAVALPAIIIKSVVLALAASVAAGRVRKVSIIALVLVVASYQIVGGIAEWGITGSIQAALQDFKIGLPGMLLQIFGGYIVLKALEKR